MGFPGPSATPPPRAGPYLRLESSSTKPCTVAVASSMWVASGAGALIVDLVPVDKDSPEWAVTRAPKQHPPRPTLDVPRLLPAPQPHLWGMLEKGNLPGRSLPPLPLLLCHAEVVSPSGTTLGSEIFFASCLKGG